MELHTSEGRTVRGVKLDADQLPLQVCSFPGCLVTDTDEPLGLFVVHGRVESRCQRHDPWRVEL